MSIELPAHLAPEPAQIPAWLTTPQQRDRWMLAFAITRMFTGRDDPVFLRQLYESDFPTGNLLVKVQGGEPVDEPPSGA